MVDRDLIKEGAKLIRFYKQHPDIAAYDLLNVDLATPQRVVLKNMWTKPYVMVVASRGFGKTFILALYSVLKSLLYPGTKIGWISATFRQSKFIYAEAEKLYQNSPIFRAACERAPVQRQDSWYIKMKGVGNTAGGIMEAVPLGDGNKIRGMRAHVLCCDEFPQIPEEVFDRVILPMAAVRLNPMARVRRKEQEAKLRAAGLLGDSETLDDDGINQVVIASSAYFKFNHFYQRYLSYVNSINKGDDRYAVFSIPYYDMPDHFYEQSVIDVSKQQQSDLEFRMEYLAEFISDSDGFYKASLLESCEGDHSIQLSGDPGVGYALGVDPARTEDSCGIVVCSLESPSRVVYVNELKNKTFQVMAAEIYRLVEKYDIRAIYMDAGAGGGGTSIRDLLQAGQGIPGANYEPIVELDSPLKGRRLITLVNMSNEWSSETNHRILNMMEKQDILFPRPPLDALDSRAGLRKEDIFEHFKTLKTQLLSITPQATSMGKVKFDVPKGKGHAEQKKDLYSAFLLAERAVYDIVFGTMSVEEVTLTHRGVVHNRDTGITKPGTKMNVPQQFKDKLIPGYNIPAPKPSRGLHQNRAQLVPRGEIAVPERVPVWKKKR